MAKGKKAPHLTAVGDEARPTGRCSRSIARRTRSPSSSGTRPCCGSTACGCWRSRSRATSTARCRPRTSWRRSTTACCATTRSGRAGRGATGSCSRKGHAAPIQYAALARHGYFPMEDLMGLRKLDAHLQGHPDMTRTPGRRGLHRLARPGPFDVARHRARAAAGRDRRGARVRAHVGRRLPGGPDLGGARWPPPTSASRT